MKNKRKLRLRWILPLVLLIIAGSLLVYAINYSLGPNGTVSFGGMVRADTFYVIVIFLLMIPVLLALLLAAGVYSKKKPQKKQPAKTLVYTEDGAVTLASALDAAAVGGKKKEDAAEVKERFCMLGEIDRNSGKYGHAIYDKGITLDMFCEDFRNYAASRHKLYYDISDIRRFVAGMAVSKLVILQGMSGTGKTSLAHAFGSFTDNTSTVIPVQPMWKERTDLVGYYNEFTKRFNETLLLQKMYEANYSKDMYITVLDEMNIARVEYYFAEFLSLLELPNPEERYIDVVSDKWDTDPKQLKDGRIKLPENMWFIGTANNDDSTFAISDKVYDRAMILNLDAKSERFAAPKTKKTIISSEQFVSLVDQAIKEYGVSKRNKQRLEMLDKYLIDHFHITFGNRIMKQINTYIPVYVACGGDELEALDDILAKKVIRKLETQNPIYLRNTAEGLLAYIDELFGAENMTLCKEHIHRLQRNA